MIQKLIRCDHRLGDHNLQFFIKFFGDQHLFDHQLCDQHLCEHYLCDQHLCDHRLCDRKINR